MTEVLPPPNLSHLMCSPNGHIQDLSACNNHSSSYIGTEQESENSTRQDYSHPQPLSDMGLRYVTIPSDDVRFPQDSVSHSPVYSLETSVQNPPSTSALSFSQYPNVYQHPTHNLSAYSNGHAGNAYFSPLSIPDIKPRIGSLSSSPALAPFSRSPALSNITSPISVRDIYSSHTPGIYRRPSDLLTRSPSLSSNFVRGAPLSPTSTSGFTSPLSTMEASSLGVSTVAVPPLVETEVHYYLTTSDGQKITPEIFGRIEKGFFMADNDWTCYRRNYFSLNCSYTLKPSVPNATLYIQQIGGGGAQCNGFAMSIAAVVDGRDGKAIELVQHTPKRDKGPQEKPARIALAPRPSVPSGHPHSHGLYSDASRSFGDHSLSPSSAFAGGSMNPSTLAMEATFERIQFKNATANNGKRRAAQQYYHLLVELYADVGAAHSERWLKIASRMSAPMVVRGRSPGHYQGERRGSNTSTGPGSGGAGGAGAYTPSAGSAGRTPGDVQMGGMGSSSMGGGSYGGYGDSRGHYGRTPLPLNIPMEPTLSQEEAKSIEESPCYLYYPAAMWEGGPASNPTTVSSLMSETRVLPSLGPTEYKSRREPYEYHSGGGYQLPSLAQEVGAFGRSCGRWEGVDSSKGFFPTVGMQGEMNIT